MSDQNYASYHDERRGRMYTNPNPIQSLHNRDYIMAVYNEPADERKWNFGIFVVIAVTLCVSALLLYSHYPHSFGAGAMAACLVFTAVAVVCYGSWLSTAEYETEPPTDDEPNEADDTEYDEAIRKAA